MACGSCGRSQPGTRVRQQASYGRWVVALADGTELPYASEWEAREAQQRNPGSTYAWVTTE